MTPNQRRVLTGLAVTGVLGGALAGGSVALASTGSTHSPRATTAAVATPTATATPTPAASGGCKGMAGLPGPGGPRGLGIMWDGQSVTKAIASYLGVSQNRLQSQLDSGKSLAEVATADGKSVSGLKNAIIAAITTRINAASGLTAAQKADLISGLKSHIAWLVNSTFPFRFGMPDELGPPAMMGGLPAM
jgi:hypothetical protein